MHILVAQWNIIKLCHETSDMNDWLQKTWTGHATFLPVVDWWATLVSSPVSLPLVKPFIGQLLGVSFTSSLAPKKWQNDHNS